MEVIGGDLSVGVALRLELGDARKLEGGLPGFVEGYLAARYAARLLFFRAFGEGPVVDERGELGNILRAGIGIVHGGEILVIGHRRNRHIPD